MPQKRAMIVLGAAAALLLALPAVTAFGGSTAPKAPEQRLLAASALGSAFTYQGRLTENGQPANGPYDMQFILYDALSGGVQIGDTETIENVLVSAGVFTVTLDFGAGAFNGDARWLEIGVKPDSPSGTFTVLSPRQPVTPTPYALFAKSAAGLLLPFAGSADTDSPGAAFSIEQTGDGTAIFAERSTDGAAPAIFGVNTGNGPAVRGETNGGVGVEGAVSGEGVAGRFLGDGPGTDALEIADGAIRVTGNNATRPAFVVTAEEGEGGNTCDVLGTANAVAINHAFADENESALLFVTQAEGGDPVPFQVVFGACGGGNADNWAIVTSQNNIDGYSFNVLVISTPAPVE